VRAGEARTQTETSKGRSSGSGLLASWTEAGRGFKPGTRWRGGSGGADTCNDLLLLLGVARENWASSQCGALQSTNCAAKISDADQAFVANIGREARVEFHSDSVDVAKKAKKEAGQPRGSGGRGATTISDHWTESGAASIVGSILRTIKQRPAEHLLRGTGLAGLGGLSVAGPVVRPDVSVRRSWLRRFCALETNLA